MRGDGEAAGAVCANCAAPLGGKFCAACGQPAHVHRSLGHMVEEALHGILHFDTKAWRTLPLLAVRPGGLTRRYIAGERARFISPLALFLFVVFLVFFVVALSGGVRVNGPAVEVADSADAADPERGVAVAALQAAAAQRARLEEEVARRRGASPEALAELDAAISERRARLAELEAAARQAGGDGAGPEIRPPEVMTGNAKIDQKIRDTLSNPELASYKIFNSLYKYAVLLVPVSVPFIWLVFFWKRGVTLYDHTVFALYSASFMAIYLMIVMGLGQWTPTAVMSAVMPALVLVPPTHLFFQLKGGYGLGWFSAAWRTLVLGLMLLIALGVFFMAVIALGLIG